VLTNQSLLVWGDAFLVLDPTVSFKKKKKVRRTSSKRWDGWKRVDLEVNRGVLGLDIVDGVGGLDLEGDSLSGESLDEDLPVSERDREGRQGI
jgi:hypothetical protein